MNCKIIFLGVLLIVSSCNKGETEPTPHVNTFSASVNGIAFVWESIEVLFGGSSVPGTRQVNISAEANNGREITLIMPEYDGTVTTYNADKGAGCYSSPTAYLGLSCSDGMISEIKLNSIDKGTYKTGEVVTGTFHFETDSTNEYYHVTGGNFSVFISNN